MEQIISELFIGQIVNPNKKQSDRLIALRALKKNKVKTITWNKK